MACRIRNTGKHPLRLDLRNGETLHLKPGETSPALREELLYGNTYLADWEARGLAARQPAAMSDVLEHERKGAGRPAPEPREAPRRPPAPSPGEPSPRTGGGTPGEPRRPSGEPPARGGPATESGRTG